VVLIQSKKHVIKTVKTKKFVILVLIVFFCFVNFNAYAEYLFPTVSWFIIKDISEEAKNNLEFVEYHINKVDDEYRGGSMYDYPYDEYFQEYTLYNNGDVPYTVRMGVGYQYSSEAPNDLFRINDVPVQHQLDWLYNPFAFIDVLFPPREKTRIRVNDFSYTHVFKGTPSFTATIGIYFLDEEHHDLGIEMLWINDILFNRRVGITLRDSLVAMIEQEGSLSNRLFDIRKTNENTWEIEFFVEFVDRFRNNLAFEIEWGQWGYDLNMNDRGLRFNSEEELSPYRYIFLTNKQLQVIRNAYYARHGYIFRNPALRRMYEEFDFPRFPEFGNINYKPNPNFHEGMLTDIDRANIEIIRRLEALEDGIISVVESEQPDSGNVFEETSVFNESNSGKNSGFITYIIITAGIVALAAVAGFIAAVKIKRIKAVRKRSG
jgi:hypothetical protein